SRLLTFTFFFPSWAGNRASDVDWRISSSERRRLRCPGFMAPNDLRVSRRRSRARDWQGGSCRSARHAGWGALFDGHTRETKSSAVHPALHIRGMLAPPQAANGILAASRVGLLEQLLALFGSRTGAVKDADG